MRGGIFALLGLIKQIKDRMPAKHYVVITTLMLFGAALLYGDGIITPAISVLSAVEGIEVAIPNLKNLVVPLTLVILLALFAIQKKGTNKIGFLFGPIMVLWFFALLIFAVPYIIARPYVLWAINPYCGISFLWHHGTQSMWVLGSVVLCVTGGEALYADLGHFGRKAISRAWLYIAYPALLVNYFGQGARLLDPTPIANNNIFYGLVPSVIMIPMVILATMATVIASQALISGCFSLTHQAIALGVFPRMKILHTNHEMKGQIYMPGVNWLLAVGCALLVIFFKNSSNLAAAYGIAVTGTMAVTTAAFFLFSHYKLRWPLYVTLPLCGGLIAIDLTFFAANSLKFIEGGFVPILSGFALFAIMWTWKWGRALVIASYESYEIYRKMSWLISKKTTLDEYGMVKDSKPRRLVESDRMVVFMTSRPVDETTDQVPTIIRIHMKRTGVLPKYIIILTIIQEKIPHVIESERYKIFDLGHDIVSVHACFGFMEEPNARAILRDLKEMKIVRENLHRCSVEIGEEDLWAHQEAGWIDRLLTNFFERILYHSTPAHYYFGLRDLPGLAKTTIPIVVGKDHARVEIPEFALDPLEEQNFIDPDTLQPSETKFADI